MSFILAYCISISGHETTTQTLGFSIWELARHPDKQKRLRDELQHFPEPTYDDFQTNLPYLDAVMRETYVVQAIVVVYIGSKKPVAFVFFQDYRTWSVWPQSLM